MLTGSRTLGSCQGFVQQLSQYSSSECATHQRLSSQCATHQRPPRQRNLRACKAALQQQGLSAVELALMLSLLMPLTLAALFWGSHLHRSWQLEETGMAAARYVSNIEPSSLIHQDLIDEQIRQRCEDFSKLIVRAIPGFRLHQCERLSSTSLQVEIWASPRGLLSATQHQSRWTLPN